MESCEENQSVCENTQKRKMKKRKKKTSVMWPQFPQNKKTVFGMFHAPPRCSGFHWLFLCLHGKTCLCLRRFFLVIVQPALRRTLLRWPSKPSEYELSEALNKVAYHKRLQHPQEQRHMPCNFMAQGVLYIWSFQIPDCMVWCRLLNNNVILYTFTLYPYAKTTSELTPVSQVLLFVSFLSVEEHLTQT